VKGRRRSATLACRYAVSCGSDPHCLYIQILFHLLNTGFATIAAHLVAAERDGRIHRLVAIDPHRARAQPLREAVRLADIARPYATPEAKGRGIAATDDLVDIGERDRRDDRAKDLLLGNLQVVAYIGVD